MECSSLNQSTQSEGRTNKRIRSSRVLKFSLIVVLILAALYIVSVIAITKLTGLIATNPTKEVIDLVSVLAALIKIDVAAAIGTIATACIARYGLREVASNINSKDGTK